MSDQDPKPHPSTRGWGEPEPPATAWDPEDPAADEAADGELLDDEPTAPGWPAEAPGVPDGLGDDPSVGDAPRPAADDPAPPLPDEDDWGDGGDEAEGWDDLAAPTPSSTGALQVWSDLEDERRLLPPGLELLGRVEEVRLMGVHGGTVAARLDTGASRSRLHAEILGQRDGRVRLNLQGEAVSLPLADRSGDAVSVSVQLHLAGLDLPATLRVHPPTDGEPLVLGCDVLAGRFVVHPGAWGVSDG